MDKHTSIVQPIRVVIVDDHEISRAGLAFALEQHPDIRLVGEAQNGIDAIALMRSLQGKVDVIVMDIQMNGPMDGIEATKKLYSEWSTARVLLLTSSEQHAMVGRKAGATGYVLKGSPVNDVIIAIRAVYRGALYFEVAPDAGIVLTKDDLIILELIASGLSNKEIAKRIGWSDRSVITQVNALYRKLNVQGREQAVREGMRHGFIH